METCKAKNIHGKFSGELPFVAKDFATNDYAMHQDDLTDYVVSQLLHNGGWKLTGGRVAMQVLVYRPESMLYPSKWLIVSNAYRPWAGNVQLTDIKGDKPEEDAIRATAAEFFLDWAKPYWEKNKDRWEEFQFNEKILRELQNDLLYRNVAPWGQIYVNINMPNFLDRETGVEENGHEHELHFMDGSTALLTPDDGPKEDYVSDDFLQDDELDQFLLDDTEDDTTYGILPDKNAEQTPTRH